MKLNNMTIAPKLGILVGVTLLGLCIAGALAGYLMQQEMLRARVDQTRSIVEMARNMAGELKAQVDARVQAHRPRRGFRRDRRQA